MTAQPRRVPKSSSGATTALWSHACGLAGRSPGASAARGGSGASNTVTVDRKSVVEGRRVSVRVDLGGRRIIKQKKDKNENLERKPSTETYKTTKVRTKK